jgi:hypothetical protein
MHLIRLTIYLGNPDGKNTQRNGEYRGRSTAIRFSRDDAILSFRLDS